MNFANPLWLWGLSALSIPIAIHLLSRKEGKVISVGSLRYLKDANTQQFKSLRLNEVILLLLRCLLFVLVVLFISRMQIIQTNNLKWILLEETLENNPKATSISDSLIKQGYELYHITPKLEVVGKISASPSYWALAEQLKKVGVAEAVMITAARAEDFKGLRTSRPSSLQWISLPIPDHEYLIGTNRTDKNNIIIKSGIIQNENTHFTKSTSLISLGQTVYKSETDSISITPPDTIKIRIASDPSFMYDKQILLASLKAIQSVVSEHLTVEESTSTIGRSDSTDVLIWLSEAPLPSTKANTIIYYKDNSLSSLFYQQSFSTWRLTKRIKEDVALNENLGVELSKIILPNKAQWEIANKKDQRVFPEKMMWANATDGGGTSEVQKAGSEPLDTYLAILILITLITERLIAYKRNQ